MGKIPHKLGKTFIHKILNLSKKRGNTSGLFLESVPYGEFHRGAPSIS